METRCWLTVIRTSPNGTGRDERITVKKVKGKWDDDTPNAAASEDELVAPLTWAQGLKRALNIDIAMCTLCGGAFRIIAEITGTVSFSDRPYRL